MAGTHLRGDGLDLAGAYPFKSSFELQLFFYGSFYV